MARNSSFATLVTTTTPTTGLYDVDSMCIQPPAPRSSWRFEKPSARSSFRSTLRNNGRAHQNQKLFAHLADADILAFGVPPDWLGDVRVATEDSILDLADHLPPEAAEALLEIATGGKPTPQKPTSAGANPFEHPDAQRRFRVMHNAEELERALAFPWEKWTVFLHPEQRALVERDYHGPARVAGSAGTGKTIVALHRAVFLARENAESRVLLATFSDTLANALRAKLRRLISNEPSLGERIEVHSMNAIGRRLYERNVGSAETRFERGHPTAPKRSGC